MCSGYRDVLEGTAVRYMVQGCARGYRGLLEVHGTEMSLDGTGMR